MSNFLRAIVIGLLVFTAACAQVKQEATVSLDEGTFKNPPNEYKPKTWMHAMSGNMSKEGLTKDLEAMAEVGLGGLLLFNITQGIPDGPVKYASEEHHRLIAHAAQESERLGLSFGVHNCDGWTSSGGPWVTPEQSMKIVVNSEVVTNGGRLELQLPLPTKRANLYEDIAVIAYPSLSAEINNPAVKITASDKNFDIDLATDERWEAFSKISMSNQKKPWIQFEYETPRTIRSALIVLTDRRSEAEILTSEDGKQFTSHGKLEKIRTGKREWIIADQFEPLTARFFRLQLSQSTHIKEVQLSEIHKIDNLAGRTLIGRVDDAKFEALKAPPSDMIIDPKSMIDLSEKMDKNGMLKAELPEGKWTIHRFGYTSTEAINYPASKEGEGLEVDKLSRAAIKTHYDAFVKRIVNDVKAIAPNAFQYAEIDSYETGGQNWTQGFDSIFQERYGYDIKFYLPLIAGRFIEDEVVTEAVLMDYRRLICDLMAENYYGYFTELCHQDGIKSYIEPYGFGPFNDLDVGGKADLPMSEFWMNRPLNKVSSTISSAHIYGKNLISAESFTSTYEINWKGHPGMFKLSGDRAWARGINEFMMHRFAHQANTNVVPGMTMNRWGFHFDRTQTWWYNAGKAWLDYAARGSYLLRQGVPVSDLLIFIGDGAPHSIIERESMTPPVPMGINFDCVNADVLLNRIKVVDGRLVLPEGTSYKALILENVRTISLATLERIVELQRQGAIVAGHVPQQLIGLKPNAAQVAKFEELKATLESKLVKQAPLEW